MTILHTAYSHRSSFVERHRAATAGLCGGLIALNILLLCVTPSIPMPVFAALSILCAWLTVIHLVTGRFPRIGWLNFGLWIVLRLLDREGDLPGWSLLIAGILFSLSILFASLGALYAAGTVLYLIVGGLL